MKSLVRPLLLAVFFLVARDLWAASQTPPKTPAPPFPPALTWVNSEPLSKKIFHGKVTLVYFWDYTSLNCLRDMTFIKKWYETYSSLGFQVIFVHAPEFDFAKDSGNVEAAIKRYGIIFPVVLDNDFTLWKSYKVFAWPTKVFVAQDGSIQHVRAGEGEYLETEGNLRLMLENLNKTSALPPAVLDEEPIAYNPEICGPMNAETYIGYKRAHWWGGEVANRNWIRENETTIFKDRGDRVQRGFFLHGLWKNHEDHFEHARHTDTLTDYLGMLYFGHDVYSVLGKVPELTEARVYVTREESPLSPDLRGVDIQEDDGGRTYVQIEEDRLYHLIHNEDEEQHEIKLWTQDQGILVSSLSFSNYCLGQIEISQMEGR